MLTLIAISSERSASWRRQFTGIRTPEAPFSTAISTNSLKAGGTGLFRILTPKPGPSWFASRSAPSIIPSLSGLNPNWDLHISEKASQRFSSVSLIS